MIDNHDFTTKSDADQRANAQTEYEEAIEAFSWQCRDCNLDEIWDDDRNHWNAATGQAADVGHAAATATRP